MYRYKIGYTSYEESSFVELEHELKYTEEQLADVVADATVEVIKQMKALPKEAMMRVHSFQDICSGSYTDDGISLADCLINKFGFKPIVYEQVFSVFGWPSIFHKTDWKGDRSVTLNKITDRVLAAGFTIDDDDYLRSQKESRAEFLKENPNYLKEHPEEDIDEY